MTLAARSYVRRKSRKSTQAKRSGVANRPSGTPRPLRAASRRMRSGGAVPSRCTCSSASGGHQPTLLATHGAPRRPHRDPARPRAPCGGPRAPTLDGGRAARRPPRRRSRRRARGRSPAGGPGRPRAPIGATSKADGVVDRVVLAPAVAAQPCDDEADRARVHRRRPSRGAAGATGARDRRRGEVLAGVLDEVGRAAERGDHRAEALRRAAVVERALRELAPRLRASPRAATARAPRPPARA